jgi:hypothetical protein
MYEPMDFSNDAEPIVIPVKIGKKNYVLKEASEDAVTKYRAAQSRGGFVEENGRFAIPEGASEAESVLVAACLYEVYQHEGEDKERPVILSQVRAWKHSIVRQLFDRVREISNLEQPKDAAVIEKEIAKLHEKLAKLKKGDPAKNSHCATTDISV